MTYVKQIIIGITFIGVYFVVFRTLILKFNIKTPGREDDAEESKLYTKADFKEKQEAGKEHAGGYAEKAGAFLAALGGRENIGDVTNCITRLRVTVKDEALVQDAAVFKTAGAHGLVAKGKAMQVIVGMSVPQVRDEFEKLLS